MYDPRCDGALCDQCPLNGNKVIKPERGARVTEDTIATGASIALVGEAPGDTEERTDSILGGYVGEFVLDALTYAGISRKDCHTTNVILCKPPKNRLKDFNQSIKRKNKEADKEYKKALKERLKRIKKGEPAGDLPEKPVPLLNPVECCAPRLHKELEKFKKFITFGGIATHAVTGAKGSISALRGYLMELPRKEGGELCQIMPTLTPYLCTVAPRWMHVFKSDIQKAKRMFEGKNTWVVPEIIYQPSPQRLREFFEKYRGEVLAYDLETDGIEPLEAKIRCVGVGNTKEVMLVSVLSKDGVTKFYEESTEKEIIAVFKEYFEDLNTPKYGWNSITYDSVVLRKQWQIEVYNHIDGILLHKSSESELPHSLSYVGSLFTDAPAWKIDREGKKKAVDAETDRELATYCGYDVAITESVRKPLENLVAQRQQETVYETDKKIQVVCRGMHQVGMYVDEKRRHETEIKLLARRYELMHKMRDFLGNPTFNPGSVQQVRDILYTKWKIDLDIPDKEKYTALGDPSTSGGVLREMLTLRGLEKSKRQFVKWLIYYRKIQKVLGTYVAKLRNSNIVLEGDLGWDEDEDWVDGETREKYGVERRGIVCPVTQRMYPGWSASIPVTGRLSSMRPINAMNFPHPLRALVTAATGNVLVGADADQLEIRCAASIWEIEKYLLAFQEGKDPHSMTAFMIFGLEFCKAAGVDPKYFEMPGKLVGKSYDESGQFIGKGEAKALRSLSKGVHFACQYKAGVKRAHKMIQATEKDNGDGTVDYPYALLPFRDVRKMRNSWLKGAPEYEKGWEKDIQEWRDQGYLIEPVGGRRRDFLDSHGGEEGVNELVNFKIQASAAGWMNKALLEIYEQIPEEKWGPGTGIINQCHDHIVVECPEKEAEWVAEVINQAMNGKHLGLPNVNITAKAEIGLDWASV